MQFHRNQLLERIKGRIEKMLNRKPVYVLFNGVTKPSALYGNFRNVPRPPNTNVSKLPINGAHFREPLGEAAVPLSVIKRALNFNEEFKPPDKLHPQKLLINSSCFWSVSNFHQTCNNNVNQTNSFSEQF